MELRKCECGGDANLAGICEFYEVYCTECDKSSKLHNDEVGAIQAWNEGKVE